MYKNVNNKKTNNKFEEINKLNKINDAWFIKKVYQTRLFKTILSDKVAIL